MDRREAAGPRILRPLLWEEGRLTAAAQQVLAACHAEAGDLAKADAILTDLLAERLPAFQEAQRELESAAERVQKAIVERAKAGDLDPDVKRKLDLAVEADRPGIFRAWLSEKIGADPGSRRGACAVRASSPRPIGPTRASPRATSATPVTTPPRPTTPPSRTSSVTARPAIRRTCARP